MLKKLFAITMLTIGITCISSTAFAETAEEDTKVEGYTEEGDGCTSVVTWCKNEDLNIFGKFYYPEDFDENKTYPVIIMCHGTDATHEIYEKGQWPQKMAQDGYISYVFDFCGGSPKTSSDLTVMELSGETMQSDINSIIEYVKSLPYCNPEEIFLMGQSRGGIMAAVAAGRHADEIAGLILMYPGFGMIDRLHEEYPSLDAVTGDTITYNGNEFGVNFLTDVYDWNVAEECSKYKGNVIIIHGIADKTVPYSLSVDALNNYYAESASELVLITGKQSVHAFDVFYEPGQIIAWNAVSDYMESQLNLAASAE